MKIVDVFNRPLRDVRISVIDQCNLRCTYCMPAEVYPSRKIIDEIHAKMPLEAMELKGQSSKIEMSYIGG